MCGFAGFLKKTALLNDPTNTLRNMGLAIVNRGPDSSGEWFCAEHGIGLSHRRLAIVDMTASGHQPMFSSSGRYVMAFNGEIYNHLELRKVLEEANPSLTWKGTSDTETMLASFEHYGLLGALDTLVGMFAAAVWDTQAQALYLFRDRLGEKPLYYGWQDDTFLFGSELKALKAHPAFKADIYRPGISLLLRYGYIPAPYSIYENIFKLEAGEYACVSSRQPEVQVTKYWDVADVIKSSVNDPFKGNAPEATAHLETLLETTISQQMLADVPLGSFLSGGIDSSLIVSLMQKQSSRPVKTFSIGFDDKSYDEAGYAKAVAAHLKTEHHELYVSSADALDVIPKLPSIYDEPFSDSSQIPTYLVSALAREQVTVSLSGDGGDELFCGYNRYKMTAKFWSALKKVPRPIRSLSSAMLTSISPATLDLLASKVPKLSGYGSVGDKVHKAARVMSSRSAQDIYVGLVSKHPNPQTLVINGIEPDTCLIGNTPDFTALDDIQQMMALDTLSYLPEGVLTKLDRASMAVSLEGRAPFLDHRVFEFAWQLPLSMKMQGNDSKWILRQILYKYVPQALIDRPKMGFGVPLRDWLCGPLREWAETLLDEQRLVQEGYFNVPAVRALWAQHAGGRYDRSGILWAILMFQAWLQEQ